MEGIGFMIVGVTILAWLGLLTMGTLTLALSLWSYPHVASRFWRSRRWITSRVWRFFSKRRYVDTSDITIVKFGHLTVQLAHASAFLGVASVISLMVF